MIVLLGARASAVEPTRTPLTPSLSEPQVQRDESWIRGQIRRFQTYPRLDRAYRLIESGRLQEARLELERSLANDPRDRQARTIYIVLLYQLKDYQAAIRNADIILAEQPLSVPVLLYRGLARQAADQLDDAIADFQAVASAPKVEKGERVFALNMVADIEFRRQNYAGALAALDSLVKMQKDFDTYFRQGIALEGLQRLAEADAAYHQALSLTSDPAERIKTLRALGENAKKRQDLAGAKQAFEAALELDPRNPELMRALADIAYDKRDYAETIHWIRQLLTIRPSVADQEFLANVLYATKDYPSAIEAYRQLLSGSLTDQQHHRIYMSLGYAHTNLRQYAQAVDAFRMAAKIKKDLPTLMALSQALDSTGRFKSAAHVLQEAVTLYPSPELHVKLGLLYAKAGEEQKALSHLQDAVHADLPADLKRIAYRQLGYTYHKQGRYVEARQAFQQAVALDPKDSALYTALGETYIALGAFVDAIRYLERGLALRETPDGLRTLALAHISAGNLEKAARINRRLLSLKGLSLTERGDVLENLGLIYSRLGQDRLAANTFQEAIATGRDEKRIRLSLGLTLAKMKRWQDALEQFLHALEIEKSARSLLYVGRAYRELENPALAIDYLTRAIADKDQLSPTEQRELYNELGYLYAEQRDYARAADLWKHSLALEYDSIIALSLGRMQRLLGLYDEGRKTLEGIPIFTLPPTLQAERLDELAQIYAKDRDFERAIEAQKQANSLAPAAQRQYQIALFYRDLGRIKDAIPYYKAAMAQEPQNKEYAMALGYAYNQIGRYHAAAQIFETIAERAPGNVSILKELGYLHLRDGNTEEAARWFKRAIDTERHLPIDSQEEQEQRDLNIYRMRQEVSWITNRFDLTLYQSYRSSAGSFAITPTAFGGGVIPSQGGAELSYQPPVVGFRDERILQFFTRLLWTTQPRSLDIDEDSLQGSIGLRYKPFKTQNFFLSAEKLFKVGRNSDDNWLLRALYGWGYDTDLRPDRLYWNYTLVYGDLGYFIEAPSTWAYYGEVRQGLTFNIGNSLLISPHLVIDGRVQSPDPGQISYFEGGGGVSFKYLFNETSYEAYRSSIEVLLQYKAGIVNSQSGWVITGILWF